MTDKRLLILWDDLTTDQKRAISNCTGMAYSDVPQVWNNILDHCTTPLRPPEEVTAGEFEEVARVTGYNTYNIDYDVRDLRAIYNAVLEIATRPAPKSAIEEMDDIVDDIEGNAECGDLEEAVRGLRGKWQAVKKEIQG